MKLYTHISPSMAWCYIVFDPSDQQHYKVAKRASGWRDRAWYRGAVASLRPVAPELVPAILARCGVPAQAA